MKNADVFQKPYQIKRLTPHRLPDGCLVGGYRVLSPTGAMVDKVTGDLRCVTMRKLHTLAAIKAIKLSKGKREV